MVDGWCASVVIITSYLDKREYSDLSKQDNTYNHIFDVEKSFNGIQTTEC